MKSWYEILEVPQSASTADIRSAYLKMAREYHPDRVPEHLTKLRADAEDKFKQVQAAWAVLGDPARRRRYDLSDRVHEVPSSPSPTEPIRPTAARQSIREVLRRRQELARWILLVLVATLLLVVAGELVISRQSSGPVATRVEVPRQTQQNDGTVSIPGDKLPPRHIQTWRAEGGNGLEVHLAGINAKSDELEVTFRVRAGERSDLLLYEPPGGSGRTKNVLGKEAMVDRDLNELYVEDNNGTKYLSTTGFVGGRQTNFNLYNFTRRINLKSHEEVVLSAKFPPIATGAKSIAFVSPALGKWQPEWRWPTISLK